MIPVPMMTVSIVLRAKAVCVVVVKRRAAICFHDPTHVMSNGTFPEVHPPTHENYCKHDLESDYSDWCIKR